MPDRRKAVVKQCRELAAPIRILDLGWAERVDRFIQGHQHRTRLPACLDTPRQHFARCHPSIFDMLAHNPVGKDGNKINKNTTPHAQVIDVAHQSWLGRSTRKPATDKVNLVTLRLAVLGFW